MSCIVNLWQAVLPHRHSTIILAAVCLLATNSCRSHEELRVAAEPIKSDPLIAKAALRGVEWLLANQRELGGEFAFSNAHKLYRAVRDQALAERLLKIVREEYRVLDEAKLPEDFSGVEFLRWESVYPVVKQLIRRECENRSNSEIIERLSRHIRRHGQRILNQLPLNQRIVAAFYLQELGIGDNVFYQETVSELRSDLKRLYRKDSLTHLYSLTHVIFTASGYYDHYLDSGEFEAEKEALLRELLKRKEIELKGDELDITAEMLICLKLLQVPLTDDIERLRLNLAKAQQSDGSWGSSGSSMNELSHHTLVSTLALIEFSPSFRGGRNFRCVP